MQREITSRRRPRSARDKRRDGAVRTREQRAQPDCAQASRGPRPPEKRISLPLLGFLVGSPQGVPFPGA